MQKKGLTVIISSIVILLVSCAKEGPAGPTGPAGPSLTGSISGHVMLYDKYGGKVLIGVNNVGLYLNGSSTVVHPDTATGGYVYNGLITGVYSLSAYNNGYAAKHVIGLQLISGNINVDMQLSAIPDSFLRSFTTVLNADGFSDSLTVTCAADPRPRNFIVFLYSTDSVSNITTKYLLNYIGAIAANDTSANVSVPKQDLTNVGFTSGAKVYYAAYSYVVNDVSVFEDYATGRNVYEAVNAIPIIDSAIAP